MPVHTITSYAQQKTNPIRNTDSPIRNSPELESGAIHLSSTVTSKTNRLQMQLN